MEKKPRKYQEKASIKFALWMDGLNDLASIILPTGTGKTFSTINAIKNYCEQNKKIKVLWIAHREELIEQAYNEFVDLMPGANVQIEQGKNKASPEADIIVGTVQTLYRERKNIKGFRPNLLVIDEYHHYDANNKSYHGVKERYNTKTLGLTATPYRFSGGDLPLGDVLVEMDIGTAVRHNFLVPPKPTTLKTDVSLTGVHMRAGDFAINELSKAVNVSSRNKIIANKIIQVVKEEKRQGIMFGVDVAHAKAIYNLIKNEVRAAEVYGETPKEERHELMKQVRNGEIDVLCNNLVCTEGFDVPHMSFACIARPTRSLGLYTQMLGRPLRLFENKSDALIIDVFDKIKTTQQRITYADFASAGDIDGSRHRASAVIQEEIADKIENFPVVLRLYEGGRWVVDNDTWFAPSWMLSDNQWVTTWTKREERKETNQTEWVNLKRPPSSYHLSKNPMSIHHRFWGDGKAVSMFDNHNVVVQFDKFGEKKILFSDLQKQDIKYEKIKLDKPIKRAIFICMLPDKDFGRFISLQRQGRTYEIIDDIKGDKTTLNEMIKVAAEQDDMVQIVKSEAPWRKRPASDKQKAVLKRIIDEKRIGDDIDLDTITGGDASVIMEQVNWHEPINNLFGAKTPEELIGYNAELDDVGNYE